MRKPIDVKAAMQKIESFGYTVGYLQTETFLVCEPPDREIPRHIAISVYEMESLAQAGDLAAFEKQLNEIRKTPAPGLHVPVHASA